MEGQIYVTRKVRLLNFAQKDKMTDEIHQRVGEVYGYISAVDTAQGLLNDLFNRDHELREPGNEKKYLKALETTTQRLSNDTNRLFDGTKVYIDTINIFDRVNCKGTTKLIAKVQREMPNKIVNPTKLRAFVMEKIDATNTLLNLSDNAYNKWQQKLSENKEERSV